MKGMLLLFSRSVMSDFVTLWTAACQASLSFTIFRSLLKLMSIELVLLSNHLILCCPLLLSSIFPSIRGFSNESALHLRWPENWSFIFSISPSNKCYRAMGQVQLSQPQPLGTHGGHLRLPISEELLLSGLGPICCVDHGAGDPHVTVTQHRLRVRCEDGQAGSSLRLQSESDVPSQDDRRECGLHCGRGPGAAGKSRSRQVYTQKSGCETQNPPPSDARLRATCAPHLLKASSWSRAKIIKN